MGKIYCLMGKSATGKDTVYRELLKVLPELRTYVMYTTRPMRENEKEGSSYFFTDGDHISSLRAEGKIIESRTYDTVFGPWTYATVDDGQIDLSKGDYLMPGTLESFFDLRKYYGEEKVLPVYIETDDRERLQRAINRETAINGPGYGEICRRFLSDEKDFSEENLKKAGIGRRFENDDLGRCVMEIRDYILEN